jgi:predicted HAD superfamily Cof-like phosphohydrolase
MSKSNALDVLEFTEGSIGISCPTTPQAMNKSDVLFIIRMIISELDELACTVTSNSDDRDALLTEAMASRDKCKNFSYNSNTELIGAQADALVDSWYYSLNTAAKCGINLSSLFDVVHAANMAKRDPATNTFIRRESDGKIIKPAGWQPPNIEGEIDRQQKQGSWTPTQKVGFDHAITNAGKVLALATK